MDGWLVAAVAIVAGSLFPAAPSETATCGALLLAMALVARRPPPVAALRTTLVAVGAFSLSALRAEVSVLHWDAASRSVRADLPHIARCSGDVRVRTSPTEAHGHAQWGAESLGLHCEGGEVRAGVRMRLYSEGADLARGDIVAVIADLAPPQRFQNAETGDSRIGEAARGIALSGGAQDARVVTPSGHLLAWIDRARARTRRRIDASFDDAAAPMVRAMVLGESDLAPEDDAAFRASGLSHLLAVSGMHLVLVVLGVERALRGLLVRLSRLSASVSVGRLSALASIPLVWGYAEFAGGGGSTLRAAWMMTFVLSARAAGRAADGARTFAFSAVVMWVCDPLVALDVSFALSAAATAGLLSLARPWGAALAALAPPLTPLARMVATTLAASASCTPLLLHLQPTLGVGGLVANVLAVPVGEGAALPLCLLHPLLAAWPVAERGCAMAAAGTLAIVRAIAHALSAPWLSTVVPPPTAWQTMLLALALGALVLTAAPWRMRTLLCVLVAYAVVEVRMRVEGQPRGLLRATFLDVGQGDATLIDLPDGSAMLIDGGGLVGSPVDTGVRVIGPVLAARRRRVIDTVVLSHPHPDHVTGLSSGLAATRVGAFWDNGEGERRSLQGPYRTLLESMRRSGTPVVRPAELCGAHSIGGAKVEVLAPCPGPDPDRGDNDNSLVIRVTFGTRSLLLVGDAEAEEEAELLKLAPEELRADVLKVGHHGSRTSSSPAFISAVRPAYAIVSSGVRNRFGHPTPQALHTLSVAGATVLRTDDVGAVVFSTDGATIQVAPEQP